MKSVVFASVAGLASIAAAQNFTLSIVPSASTISEGGTFTLSVYGDADVGTHLLGGAFSLETNNGCIDSMSWTPAAWSSFNSDGGDAGDGNYNEVIFGQLVIPGIFPPAAGSEVGALIGSFQVSMGFGGGDGAVLDFQLVAGSPFTLETVDGATGDTYQSSSGSLTLGNARVISFACVPTPGSCSLLCVGGLIFARRRRVG